MGGVREVAAMAAYAFAIVVVFIIEVVADRCGKVAS